MPILVADRFLPKNGLTFPLIEDLYLIGGFRVVETMEERDSFLSDPNKKQGLKKGAVFVVNETGVWWHYDGNNGWIKAAFKDPTGTTGFTFQQTMASTLWTVMHNVSQYFTVDVFVNNEIVNADIKVVNNNMFTAGFATPQTGYVVMNFPNTVPA